MPEKIESGLENELSDGELKGQAVLNVPVMNGMMQKLLKISIPIEGAGKKPLSGVGYVTSLDELKRANMNLSMLEQGASWFVPNLHGNIYVLDESRKLEFMFDSRGGTKVPYSPLLESLVNHSKVSKIDRFDPSYS